MKTIAILGECMIELNGKPFGDMQQTFGGDTLNAAVYLSRCSQALDASPQVQVQYVTAMGTDPLSDGMVARWQQEGVATELVLRDETRTPGLYLIQLDDQGERTFLYWRNQSAARYLLQHAEFERVAESLKQVDMVFVSGISLAILPEHDRIQLLALLSRLRAKGVEIAFDSNFRPALWPQDQMKTVQTCYQAMYQITDLALVTFDDEQLIWGDATAHDTITRLQKQGVKNVVVKLGAEGCLVADSNTFEPYSVATTPIDNVIDTTSAGDSFNGGFLATYLSGGNIKQACMNGNTLAGTVIQHKGAIIPKAATDAAIAQFKK
ncbi:sugar kinase [Vibrio owensii]|uniref:2-dehydro-3-deoxygluconokinase n=1 Tax=Vibrio owensii TaxID=696485 RepID=A0AAP9GHA9_9VIBR|nr:sugar kinase [Vibrio owensii]AYO18034.1 sugar kinase [Vibrio owensii]QGH50133.1 sugar kinase [Vibrio owensii]